MANMENPLMQRGAFFRLDLFRPAPTYSKSKGHRISFEVDAETWDMFKQADVRGMEITSKATVVHDGEDVTKKSKPSNIAHMLINIPLFQEYLQSRFKTTVMSPEDANDILLAHCKCHESKSELDRDEAKAERLASLKADYYGWKKW